MLETVVGRHYYISYLEKKKTKKPTKNKNKNKTTTTTPDNLQEKASNSRAEGTEMHPCVVVFLFSLKYFESWNKK